MPGTRREPVSEPMGLNFAPFDSVSETMDCICAPVVPLVVLLIWLSIIFRLEAEIVSVKD